MAVFESGFKGCLFTDMVPITEHRKKHIEVGWGWVMLLDPRFGSTYQPSLASMT